MLVVEHVVSTGEQILTIEAVSISPREWAQLSNALRAAAATWSWTIAEVER